MRSIFDAKIAYIEMQNVHMGKKVKKLLANLQICNMYP